ncbi:MAG: DUF58 domain-containing protein, partial [Candidatus Rokuibacteriota bacterium]
MRRWAVRALRPPRTLWPTREGWWCLCSTVGLGVAAINTGNNLLYLLLSMLLGLITVSGVLSERSIRGLRLAALLPEDIFAGRAAAFGVRVVNAKRRATSYSVAIEVLGGGRTLYLSSLLPGAARVLTWEQMFARRGRHHLPGVRITTRFPFGLFVKSGRAALATEVIVFPAVTPLSPALRRAADGTGTATVERAGRGHDLH